MTSETTHEDARRARLAAALRENLKKRKAQARSRQAAEGRSAPASRAGEDESEEATRPQTHRD